MNLTTKELEILAIDVEHFFPDRDYMKLVFSDLLELLKDRKKSDNKELLEKSGFVYHFAPRATRAFYRLLLEALRKGTELSEAQKCFLGDYLRKWALRSGKALAA